MIIDKNNSTMSTIDEQLRAFGEYRHKVINYNDCSFIRSFVKPTDYVKILKEQCMHIMNGKNVNILLLDNSHFQLMNKDAKKLKKIICDTFAEASLKIQENIAEELEKKTFVIDMFVKAYDEYKQRIGYIKKGLWYYDDNTTKNEYSHVTLMGNFIFYKNVVNQYYKYGDTTALHFEEIINNIMENKNSDSKKVLTSNTSITINNILSLYKMYKFFMKLSHVIKNEEKRLEIFNIKTNTDHKFLVTMGNNANLVKNLVMYIHNKIIKECRGDIAHNKIQDIIDIINIATNFNEPALFIGIYKAYLEDRLLKVCCNIELEKTLIQKFEKPKYNKDISCMLNKILDTNASRNDNIVYRNMEITLGKGKYEGKITNKDLEHYKYIFVPLRYDSWSFTRDCSNVTYKLPFTIEPYIDIQHEFYEQRYKHRRLMWNFNVGYAIISIELGGKSYKFKVTLPQWFVLIQFNEKERISVRELSQNLGISLKTISPIIEGLWQSTLLTHEKGNLNNPDLKFFYNKDYNKNGKYKGTNINLTTAAKNMRMKKREKCIIREFKIGRGNMIRSRIVKYLKQNKRGWENDIFKYTVENLPFKPDAVVFLKEILESIKKEGIVLLGNDAVRGREFKYLLDAEYKGGKEKVAVMKHEAGFEDLDSYEEYDFSSDFRNQGLYRVRPELEDVDTTDEENEDDPEV